MTIEKKIESITERHGYEPQSHQCIEETVEPIRAINKPWRKRNFGRNDRQIAETEDAVLDEMAGTLIMP